MSEMIKTDNVYYEYKSNSDDGLRMRAVNGISVTITQGQFVVVLGRNGSGKSTLARLMNALLIPKKGTVLIDGLDTRNGDLVWQVRKTLGLVFQNPDNQIVATTVEEDVAFGPENLGIHPREIRKRVDESLRLVGMDKYSEYSPHMLSGGQKQRIAIAGILSMAPKCIVLDESTSMLDPLGRKEVMDVLYKLNRDKGITIILITHHMEEAAEADKVLVMEDGRIILEGTPGQIFDRVDEIRKAGLDVPQITSLAYHLKKCGLGINRLPVKMDEMLGIMREFLSKSFSAARTGAYMPGAAGICSGKLPSRKGSTETIIKISGLSHFYMPDTSFERKAVIDVNLTVNKGEILGIIGHTGSGKTTLVQHLNGILKPSVGSIEVDGLKAEGKELKDLRRKVGLIFQYPEYQLFEETVYKDITFGLSKMGLSREETNRRVFHAIDLLGVPPELLEKSPFELSGGEKRRVAIAGVLVMEPRVLVLDEPTAGLDPSGSHEVFSILKRLNEEGTTIILISHNMDEIAAICHRVAVMHEGKLVFCDETHKVFSRVEELRDYGLDIPKVTEMFLRLRNEGYDLPWPVLTIDEAEKYFSCVINRALGGDGQ